MTSTASLGRLAAAVAIMVCAGTVVATPVPPDTGGSSPANRGHYLKVVPRLVGTPVTLYFTHNGQRIRNATGPEVRFSTRSAPQANFYIPGQINNQVVTDEEVITGIPTDPLDPGVLQATVFMPGGIMSPVSLGTWLCANGWTSGNPLIAPEFLAVGSPIVYYSVNLAALGPTGGAFASTALPAGPYVIDAAGKIPGLPAYTFSLTPFMYAPGIGWAPTSPPPAGMVVTYEGYIAYEGDCAATPCYANCDGSTLLPVLNVNDFSCFLNRYAAGDVYANCDSSTIPPVLNVNDFTCFVNQYASGCP